MRNSLKAIIVIIMIIIIIYGIIPKEKELAAEGADIIRLHVIANSDSPEDQALKLKVRDALLEKYSEVFTNTCSIDEARSQIKSNLKGIESLAGTIIKNNGYSYNVAASLGICEFPPKMYGDKIYPAGNYEALRVVIGGGAGANWWCVMFPPLCFVDASSSISKEEKPTEAESSQSPDDTEKEDETRADDDKKGDKHDNKDRNKDLEAEAADVEYTFIVVKWWNALVAKIKEWF